MFGWNVIGGCGKTGTGGVEAELLQVRDEGGVWEGCEPGAVDEKDVWFVSRHDAVDGAIEAVGYSSKVAFLARRLLEVTLCLRSVSCSFTMLRSDWSAYSVVIDITR